MNKRLLLFPDSAEGVVIDPPASGQVSLTSDAPVATAVDWDKEAGKAPNFENVEAEVNKPAKTEVKPEGKDDNNELEETSEKKEVKQPKIEEVEKEEVQKDDEPDGNRKPEGELEKEKEVVKEQQQEENVIDKRFPEARIFRKKMDKAAAQYFDARLADVIQKEAELEEQNVALQEAQSGITQIPKSYYDNPAAIVLVPEFQRATTHVTLAAKITSHWDNQLGNIMNGEPWRKLEYIKDEAGNVLDIKPTEAEFEANGKAQHEVGKYVRNSENQLERMSQYQAQLQQNFTKKVQERTALLRETENKFFDPKTWEDKAHPNFKLKEQTKQAFYSLGVTEANPLFGIASKLAAEVMRLRSYASHKQAVADKNGKVEDKQKLAGLNGKDTKNAGGSDNKPEEDDAMAAFNKVLINR